MAGVFALIRGPQRQLIGRHGMIQQTDPRALQLQAAMEILAEVFDVRLSEISEMIRLRSEEAVCVGASGVEDGLWPREFWLEG